MTRGYEFIGGPRDGETIALPDTTPAYTIIYPPTVTLTVATSVWGVPPTSPPIRTGTYRVCVDGTLRWEGER